VWFGIAALKVIEEGKEREHWQKNYRQTVAIMMPYFMVLASYVQLARIHDKVD
jgi:hypothetical protein